MVWFNQGAIKNIAESLTLHLIFSSLFSFRIKIVALQNISFLL